MFCSQCGKKVSDIMLFCPFCGSPIVIPDQDEELEKEVVQQEFEPLNVSVDAESGELLSEINTQPDEDEEIRVVPEFIPLDVSESLCEDEGEEETAPVKTVNRIHEEPVRLQGRKPQLTGQGQRSNRKGSKTRLPQRQFDPDDIFFDGSAGRDYDDYAEDDFEEESDGGFFVRHIRGVVSLSLFALVAAIVLGWMLSGAGQMSLAKAGLAWKSSVYADLGYSAYQSASYSLAGNYYSQASDREPSNYDYANSAGVAYFMAQDTIRAEAMARRAIAIDSTRSDAYALLVRIYPDEAMRPLEVQALLQASGLY